MENTASIAIITGGGRGMGRDAALRLAQRGVSSIITYHFRRDEADKVVSANQKADAQATTLQLDVGKAASFMNFADRVRAALAQMGAERFDYLVNNAGGSSAASLADGTEAEMDARFAVHFKGPFPLTQTPPPLMNDGGRIVHISSGLTRLTFPGPGDPRTDFGGGVTRDNPEVNKALASRTALGRVGGPEDVGPVIASLLSDDLGWINGQRIEVAGGMNIRRSAPVD